MKNSRVSFNLLDKEYHVTLGYKETTSHLIFSFKMDLTRKARYVAGGNFIDTTSFINYVSVVSHDNVYIVFLISALNYLDILSGDTKNAYLNTLTKEKSFFYACDEWKFWHGGIIFLRFWATISDFNHI